VASSARAGLIALVLVACSGGDDAAVTPTTSMSTTTTTVVTTTTAPPLDLEPAWAQVQAPDASCLVVVDENGDFVFERNADVPVKPASVLKLLVASLAPDDVRVPSMLGNSDNDAARALAADLGGIDAVETMLIEQGRPMAGVDLLDATGHDHGSRVTCRLLVSILSGAPDAIRESLPEPGEGTLFGRYDDLAGRLRAKTGSIRGVGSLAGYAMPSGRPGPGDLTFAAVLNETDDPAPALDAIVHALLP
jgi:D-alanyl-D-alanine carboxypeptidase